MLSRAPPGGRTLDAGLEAEQEELRAGPRPRRSKKASEERISALEKSRSAIDSGGHQRRGRDARSSSTPFAKRRRTTRWHSPLATPRTRPAAKGASRERPERRSRRSRTRYASTPGDRQRVKRGTQQSEARARPRSSAVTCHSQTTRTSLAKRVSLAPSQRLEAASIGWRGAHRDQAAELEPGARACPTAGAGQRVRVPDADGELERLSWSTRSAGGSLDLAEHHAREIEDGVGERSDAGGERDFIGMLLDEKLTAH